MKNIYYTNIILKCNNKCKFCLSGDSYNNVEGIMDETVISFILEKYKIDNQDRFIINGGEPTLHPALTQIIHSIAATRAEIVMYSNGRNLYDKEYALELVKAGVKRITIPLHGDKALHNKMTGTSSFSETIKGIKNLINVKKTLPIEIELKLVLNEYFVDKYIDIFDLLRQENIDASEIDTLIFSGLIDCEISKINKVKIPEKTRMANYASNLICNTISKSSAKIKLLDMPICLLKPEIQNEILKLFNSESSNLFNNFYVFDYKHILGNRINYKQRECILDSFFPCNNSFCCGSIMRNYNCLSRKDNMWFIDLE